MRDLGHWVLVRQTEGKTGYKWSYGAIIIIGLGWVGWWLISTTRIDAWSLSVDPFASDREANAEPEAVLAWLTRSHPAEMGQAQVVFGPSKSLPLWKFPRYFTFERIPVEVNHWQALQEYIAGVAPDYIIIDSDTARRRRQALGDYFTYVDEGVEFEHVPPGWALTYLYEPAPHAWAIFKPATRPSTPIFVKLDGQIELLGYDLVRNFEADQYRLDITLYWRALTEVKEDYTTFLHLTAADGFVKTQQDRQPFDGLWPTSRWAENDLLADQYTIWLDDWLGPGEYLLLAGLYEGGSGRRLAVINAPPAPAPDAILLEKIEVAAP
jgi:hypothetical protein